MKNKYYTSLRNCAKRQVIFARFLTILLTIVLLLTGCGRGKNFDASSGETEAAQIVDEASGYSGSENGYEEAKEAAAMDTEAAATEEYSGEDGPSAQKLSEKDLSSRKLIKTVSLTMQTRTFDTLKQQLEESIASCGGYIENSSYDAPGGQNCRYYYLCVRIPSKELDAFVNKAGELGTITNKSENVRDVTLDYVDKTAYKESLQTEYERVMELLAQAKNLDQILALESKLSELRYEINSYESQLRIYDNQIDYSTVNINISEVEYEKEMSDTVGSRISSGFRGSLFAVRNFFVNTFVFLVSNLPVLVLLAAGILLAVFLWKKGRKRFRRNASEEPEIQPSATEIKAKKEDPQKEDPS